MSCESLSRDTCKNFCVASNNMQKLRSYIVNIDLACFFSFDSFRVALVTKINPRIDLNFCVEAALVFY